MHGTGLIEGTFTKTHNAGTKQVEAFHRIDNFGQGNFIGRFLKKESAISALDTLDKSAFRQAGKQLPQVGPGNFQLFVQLFCRVFIPFMVSQKAKC